MKTLTSSSLHSVQSIIESQDHTTEVVPLCERRSSLTMGLLWITMVTGFPTVLAGFDWFKAGMSIPQILQSEFISVFILLLYSIPAVYLGAKSGQTYTLLSRSIFGRWGSYLVSFNLLCIFIAWYGLMAVFLCEGLKGLFPIPVSSIILSTVLAIVMTFNNFFGFTGVANFARYVAAPIMILWIGITFVKCIFACPASILVEPAHLPLHHAFVIVSSYTIGYAVWGNEADYWRYGKPRIANSIIPLVVALVIGQTIFPVTGWLMAHLSGVTDYSAATNLMVRYAFGGWSIVPALVLIITYTAVNDSELYGAINAIENVKVFPRKLVVFFLTFACAGTAACLSQCGHAMEWVASLNCIFLPTVTVIMMVEWFILNRWFATTEKGYLRAYTWSEVPSIQWPATIALILGCSTGLLTSGIIPGTETFRFGLFSLNAWVVSALSYVMLRLWLYSLRK